MTATRLALAAVLAVAGVAIEVASLRLMIAQAGAGQTLFPIPAALTVAAGLCLIAAYLLVRSGIDDSLER